ncbi:hypothetical protein BgiBS90_019595 [Biomphalaria glabrata]|nr:hypothetical protein BgiBS90_019595 [Biomphalaria glabrata]
MPRKRKADISTHLLSKRKDEKHIITQSCRLCFKCGYNQGPCGACFKSLLLRSTRESINDKQNTLEAPTRASVFSNTAFCWTAPEESMIFS